MIRRRVQLEDGRPAWLLVNQQDHAVLASELSRQARPLDCGTTHGRNSSPAAFVEEIEWAIRHHDDGWQAWDAAPGLADDPPGRPRSFDEMRVEEANAIWAKSIERARQRGPLAAWLVTRHFLLLRSVSSTAQDPEARRFAERFEPRAEASWRKFIGAAGGEVEDPAAVAVAGLDRLRWADRLSLLLCGDPPAAGTGRTITPSPLGLPQRLTEDARLAESDGRREPGTEAPGDRPAFCFGYRLHPWLADSDPLGPDPRQNRADSEPISPGLSATPASPDARLRLHWRAKLVPEAGYASVQELNQAARLVGILGVLGSSERGAD